MAGVEDQDLGMAALIAALGQPIPTVMVGVRGDADSEIVVAAAANEYGTRDGHIPERSFLRSTADEGAAKYADMMADVVEDVLDGKSATRSLNRLGSVAAGDVKRKIRDLKSPPNAPSTIEKKGSSNPLIDTGRLRQSIDFEVVS